MSPVKITTLRLSLIQHAQVAKLAQKLQIGKADVIRMAIARLAEQEGISQTPR